MQRASKEPSVILHNLEIKDSLAELDEQVEDDDEVAKTTLALKAVRQRGGGVQKKDGKGCFYLKRTDSTAGLKLDVWGRVVGYETARGLRRDNILPICEENGLVRTLYVDMTNFMNPKKSTMCPAALIKPIPEPKKVSAKAQSKTSNKKDVPAPEGSVELGSEIFKVILTGSETLSFKIPVMTSSADVLGTQLYRNRVPWDDETMAKPKVNKGTRKVGLWILR